MKVHGAGRTDSGVHALNFTANFTAKAENFKTAEKWRVSLNAVLPPDIVVKYKLLQQIFTPDTVQSVNATAT